MWDFVIETLISAVAFFVFAKLSEGIRMEGFVHSFLVIIPVSFFNGMLAEMIEWLNLYRIFNFFTFGMLNFFILCLLQSVLGAIIIWIGGQILERFYLENFAHAVGVALLIAVVCSLTNGIIG